MSESEPPPIWRSRPLVIAAAVDTVVFTGVGFLPLFAGPGYESALATGALGPSIAAIGIAVDTARSPLQPFASFSRGAAAGVAFAAIALGVSLIHGLAAGLCDPLGGLALWVLGAGMGVVLGGVWGTVAGLAVRGIERPRRRLALAIVGALVAPLLGIAVSLWRFYVSPMVFAYDPFFGFFSGPLYDTVINPLAAMVTYRLGSALTLVAAGILIWHLRVDAPGRLRFTWRRAPGWVALSAAAAIASVILTIRGSELDHYSTEESIRKTLGRSLTGKRCELVYSASILERDAKLTLRDCDALIPMIERYFDTRGPAKTTVYLFASAGEKGKLMGAANTYIAKPWRAEVYLQAALYPHPVLGHELAHVVAGAFGAGPLRIAGSLAGWLPDPGRIEGFAVAASPPQDDDFTLDEWARLMRELELLPALESVFQLGFMGKNSSVAYTVAGAFVDWMRRSYGPEALRRWYSGVELAAVTGGLDLAALERKWHAHLAQVPLAPEALELARARFDRPSVFQRRCPHAVDQLAQKAHQRANVGDCVEAEELFQELLSLEPKHVSAQLTLAQCALRRDAEPVAIERLKRLEQDSTLHRLERAAGTEALGDIALRVGDLETARSAYAKVANVVAHEDRLRALDVKAYPGSELGREAVVSLLIGDGNQPASWDVAAAKLGEWLATEPDAGLPAYLLGKNLYNRGRWSEAATYLDQALTRSIELERVHREAIKTRIVVACAEGDRARARSLIPKLAALTQRAGQLRELERLSERCGVPEAIASTASPSQIPAGHSPQ